MMTPPLPCLHPFIPPPLPTSSSPLTQYGKRASCVSSATTTSLLVAHQNQHQSYSHPRHHHHSSQPSNLHSLSPSPVGGNCSVGGQEHGFDNIALQLNVPPPPQPPARTQVGSGGGSLLRQRCNYQTFPNDSSGAASQVTIKRITANEVFVTLAYGAHPISEWSLSRRNRFLI